MKCPTSIFFDPPARAPGLVGTGCALRIPLLLGDFMFARDQRVQPGRLTTLLLFVASCTTTRPGQPHPEPRPGNVAPTLVAFIEATSFIDEGLKALVFPDGVGYLHKSRVTDDGSASPIAQLKLSPRDQVRLAELSLAPDFASMPHTLKRADPVGTNTVIADSTLIWLAFATPDGGNDVCNGNAEHESFEKLTGVLKATLQSLEPLSSQQLTAPDAVALIAKRIALLPHGSLQNDYASRWLTYVNATLLGSSGGSPDHPSQPTGFSRPCR